MRAGAAAAAERQSAAERHRVEAEGDGGVAPRREPVWTRGGQGGAVTRTISGQSRRCRRSAALLTALLVHGLQYRYRYRALSVMLLRPLVPRLAANCRRKYSHVPPAPAVTVPKLDVHKRVQLGALVKDESTYHKLHAKSVADPEAFWREMALNHLSWTRPFTRVLEGGLAGGDAKWFADGQLNVSFNCVDRHVVRRGSQTALLWEGDGPHQQRRLSYRQLLSEVCRFARLLRARGIQRGDRVALYMPMVPEAVVAMLACARIGAVHTVVFAGFSAEALRDRLRNSGAKLLVTADYGARGGRLLPLKAVADRALTEAPSVAHVLVHRHAADPLGPHPPPAPVHMQTGRDEELHVALEQQSDEYVAPEAMNAEDPLFLLYTSGSTGAPKALVHTHAGYLLHAAVSHRYVLDYRPGDVHACMADIGWITGHSYIVYGPLCNGATTLLFESVPTYPDAGRYWDVVQRHRVNIFYTAPTAIRTLMAHGDAPVRRYDRSSLRVLGSVGEPINPEAWRWYHDVVGEQRCAVVDTYWQTETGGIALAPLPGATPPKPGAACVPFFGISPVLLEPKTGRRLAPPGGPAAGVLCFEAPWPGLARSIWNDHERYMATYLRPYPGLYFTGDGAHRDADGYWWITGRVDDVINKAGHRIGTAEVEGALVGAAGCSEAAVVGVDDPVRGQALLAFVAARPHPQGEAAQQAELRAAVRARIGGLAVPDYIVVVAGLPKTRSGKIMRRILRKLGAGESNLANLGDTSTLAEPDALPALIAKTRAVLGAHAKQK